MVNLDKFNKIAHNIQSEAMNRIQVKELRLLLVDIYISTKIRNVDNLLNLNENMYEQEFEQLVTSKISTIELVEKLKQEVYTMQAAKETNESSQFINKLEYHLNDTIELKVKKAMK